MPKLRLVLFAAFACSALPGRSVVAQGWPPDPRATLTAKIPSQNGGPFVIRATVPLPKGQWLAQAGQPMPLSILEETDVVVPVSAPTQLEVVSWYPDALNDGVEVVEVISMVKHPENSRHKFKVITSNASNYDPGDADAADLLDDLFDPAVVPAGVSDLALDPHSRRFRVSGDA